MTNSLFEIKSKREFDELKFYLKRNYFTYLMGATSNFVLLGHDRNNDYPTYVHYSILGNINGELETLKNYEVHNCNSTMIFAIAQNDDVELSLTGFNEDSYMDLQNAVHDLFCEMDIFNGPNHEMMNSINRILASKINELKLNNLETILQNIEFLPDSEIMKLLDVLIQLTAVKMKFSFDVHSVGGKRIKVVLRKYEGIKFFE